MYKPKAERIYQEVENLYYYMKRDMDRMDISTTLLLDAPNSYASYAYNIKIEKIAGNVGCWLYNIKIKNTWTRVTLKKLTEEDMSDDKALKAKIKSRMRD